MITKLRELGVKEFTKRWKQGIMRLRPEQLLKAELSGISGSILGTIGASVAFVLLGMWPVLFFLVFNIVIQVVNWITKYQQLNLMRHMELMTLDQLGEENV